MKNRLGRIVLLVEDYEKSAKFYEENFGFKRLFDVTTENGQRFLHLGSEELDSPGIWFLQADTKEQRERVGRQTAQQPTMVIYTSDMEALYARLKQNEAKLKTAIIRTPDYAFFHCYDFDGNEMVVTELKKS